jgi:Protein of unknown function (DUF3606)
VAHRNSDPDHHLVDAVSALAIRRQRAAGQEYGRSEMADDRTKKDFRDKTRINVNEDYEKEYWKKRFRVSGQQLAGAVRAVGPSVKKVEKYLNEK